jgi:hypothetical protein
MVFFRRLGEETDARGRRRSGGGGDLKREKKINEQTREKKNRVRRWSSVRDGIWQNGTLPPMRASREPLTGAPFLQPAARGDPRMPPLCPVAMINACRWHNLKKQKP